MSQPTVNGLKVLCFLSFIGFVYCMAFDSSKFLTYSSYDPDSLIEDSAAYELISQEVDRWSLNKIDVSKKGIQKVSYLFLARSIFDVISLLGVTLMFYKMKLGFSIYTFSQLLYVLLPFVFFGFAAKEIVPLNMMLVNLIYVALFITQNKHFIQVKK
tara:strand:+ start:29 stop:499 length:471 start_codon:yes stop_codon:yes gene_type:complete